MRPRARRRGSITLITALGMVMILGAGALAVDYGILVADRNRLQRACDAAALAGATQLKKTGDDATDTANARSVAVTAASQNQVTVNSNDITFLNSNRQIRVPAATSRSLFFGRILGFNNKPVSASSIAGVNAGTRSTTQYVAPVGITWETYNAYKDDRGARDLSLVRQNKQLFQKDDFVLFDLSDPNGKSTAHMQDQLTGDEIEEVSINSFQTTLNASDSAQRNKLERGIDILTERAEDAPWGDPGSEGYRSGETTAYESMVNGAADYSNPRVVYIIITPSTMAASNGTYNTQVQAFVPVYIEEVRLGNKHGEDTATLTVRFLPPVSASDGEFGSDPDGSLAGVRVISLLG